MVAAREVGHLWAVAAKWICHLARVAICWEGISAAAAAAPSVVSLLCCGSAGTLVHSRGYSTARKRTKCSTLCLVAFTHAAAQSEPPSKAFQCGGALQLGSQAVCLPWCSQELSLRIRPICAGLAAYLSVIWLRFIRRLELERRLPLRTRACWCMRDNCSHPASASPRWK